MFFIKSRLLFNYYFSKYLNRDINLLYLILFSSLVIFFNLLKYETIMLDGYVWHNLTEDFFGEIGTTDGRHRPLFGFFGYLIHLFIHPIVGLFSQDTVLISWRIMNILLFYSCVILSYFSILKLTNNRVLSYLFSLFVLTSPQLVYSLSLAVPLLHGFWIFYFSLFLFIDYLHENNLETKRKKLFIYSFIIGLLMLGKAHYNIVFTIFLCSLIRLRSNEVIQGFAFLFIQAIPLALYVLILNLYGYDYQNYEFDRSDFSLLDFAYNAFIANPNLPNSYFGKLMNFIYILTIEPSKMLFKGSGIVYSYILFAALIFKLFSLRSLIVLIYYYSTSGILILSSFSLARHAGDFEPICFFFLAILIAHIYSKFNSKLLIRNLIIIIFFINFFISQSGIYFTNIHGVDFESSFPMRFEIFSIFNLY